MQSMSVDSAADLKLAPQKQTIAWGNHCLLPTGVEIECDLREVSHPEGRFRRADGTRFDICVMEMMGEPALRPPSISRTSFVGDGADSQSAVIRLGNVRMSSFRLYLISPGEAFGTLSVDGKAVGASTR
jgi:hypothetical protein